ncbi:hypothetical protein ACU61A_34510 [Pseudonocardia sichuanensis]
MTVVVRSGTEPDPLPHAPRPGSPRDRPGDRALTRAQTRLWRGAGRAPVAGLYLLVVATTVLQRIVVPGTVVFVALPIAFLVVGALAVRGHIVADVPRTLAYLGAVALCGAATLVSTGWAGLDSSSLTSLALLAVMYVPCCGRLTPALRRRFPDVLEFFQRLMCAVAVVCLGQYVAQLGGWTFEDLLSFLPSGMIASTVEYNLSYPVSYGSPIYKSNGIVFLEASFCSQFLAMAIIVQILLGRGYWRIALLAAGLATTFSGTGVVLLGAGLLVLAVRRGGRWAARAAVAVVAAVVAVSFTPAGELLVDRSTETAQEGSSGYIRFVAPYDLVLAAVPSDTSALLAGRGPGSITRDTAFFNPDHVEANYPAVPKLLGEYGVPATLAFLAFLLMMFLRRAPSATLGLMAALLFFVLSSALLTAPIVYFAWLISGLFAAGPVAGARRGRGAR